MAAWCLVSPASRGVGFAVARHLLQTTKAPIVATARQRPGDLKSKLLQDLENVDPDRLSVLTLDVMGKLQPALLPGVYASWIIKLAGM
jgi:NAD(P)-dependent dehydrogenase (short-subunit alcohol dehydrogenase family)